MEQLTLTYFLQDILGIDVQKLVMFFISLGLVLWMLAIIWVVRDALLRYGDYDVALIWGVVVLLLNLLGFVLYLIFRPPFLKEEKEFFGKYSRSLEYFANKGYYCPECSTFYTSLKNVNFCGVCGYRFKRICPKCKKVQLKEDKYCRWCGYEFGAKTVSKAGQEKSAKKSSGTKKSKASAKSSKGA